MLIMDFIHRNTKKLLTEHHADPNLVIPDNSIAPIHYAAGMENTDFAEAAMKLILKCNGNLFSSISFFYTFNFNCENYFLKEIQM